MKVRVGRFGFSALREKLMENSLCYVEKYGWSDRAIHAACVSMDLSPASHRLVTPYEMVAWSMKKWNKQALQKVDDTNFQGRKRIREKIAYSIRTRLEQQSPFVDSWAEAMRLGAHPSNINQTKQLLWSYSDEIWRRCGDISTDYNYYSKRMLFNTAYAATELFMLTDQSEGRFATWNFLERRMDDVETFGKRVSDVKVVGEALGRGVLSLFTMFSTPSQYQNPIKPSQPEKKQQKQSSQTGESNPSPSTTSTAYPKSERP